MRIKFEDIPRIIKETENFDVSSLPPITVCDKCLRASCWMGVFMCDDAQNAATVCKPIKELMALDLEHPDYWREAARN